MAVLATRTSGETEILVGDGGAVRTIADTSSGDFSSLGNPQINNAGTVAFRGSTSSEGGIFADSGSGVHLLVNYSGYYNNYGFGLNNNGEVAFIAQKGFPAEASGIFLSDGTSIQQLADVSGPIKDFSSNGPVLNDAGSAAFRAVLDSGAEGIFKTDGTTLTTIADTSGPLSSIFGMSPSINSSGQVAFHAQTDSGETGIFVGDGGPLTTIADTSGEIVNLGWPSINDAGTVAFTLTGGANPFASVKTGVYAGSDLANDAVITIGDALDGGTFGSADPNRVAINNAGQVAFLAAISDGLGGYRNAIFVATPTAVPEPTSLALTGLGLGIAVFARRRRARIGQR